MVLLATVITLETFERSVSITFNHKVRVKEGVKSEDIGNNHHPGGLSNSF